MGSENVVNGDLHNVANFLSAAYVTGWTIAKGCGRSDKELELKTQVVKALQSGGCPAIVQMCERALLQLQGLPISILTFERHVFEELSRSRTQHRPLASAHEALSVIWEELEEFKAEVFRKESARSREAMLQELVQCAAMCQRAAEDLSLMHAEEPARECPDGVHAREA